MTPESHTTLGILIAALGGAAVGVERERSGQERFRRMAVAGLVATAIASAASIAWLHWPGLHRG